MPAARRQQGFTLLELLVVLTIIGIMVVGATLSINTDSPKQRLNQEARRFSILLQMAMDESILNAKEMGLHVGDDGYQFVQLQNHQWVALEDKLFRLRQLPEDMQVELDLDYQQDSLKSRVSKIGEVKKLGEVNKFESEEEKQKKPKVYLLSSGEITPPFQLRFLIPGINRSATVAGLESGEIKQEQHESAY